MTSASSSPKTPSLPSVPSSLPPSPKSPLPSSSSSASSSASPPPDFFFDPEALDALEWSKITSWFASFCRTAWGRFYAESLPFFSLRSEIEREYSQLTEALWLLRERAESMPVSSVPDLTEAILRLEKGGHLEAPSLLEFSRVLESVGSLKAWLHRYQREAPHLWERGELFEALPKLRSELERAIDEHGQLRDEASWELGSLRQEVRSCHDRLRKKLQDYLQGPQSKHLTDTYYTLREDRYVLPVKSSERGRFPGIMYGTSASGATVYIEPQPLVELNNALRMAEQDVLQEEQRILKQLSLLVTQNLSHLLSNLQLLRDLDLIQARVQMAEALDASIPLLDEPSENAVVRLKKARHPLLILKGIPVVANDIELSATKHLLIISGPNTGGKTVSLKTLGLCSLMARAALPIPAEEGSRLPLFRSLYTDIGDQQSIEQDLSTFSAQILKIRQILQKATSQTLVLIDEIIVGTDPQQGAALASAILKALADTRAWVAITTHYEALKALPYDDPRFQNASVGFDLQLLSPTYRLYLGTPGGSSALDIARRLGLPEVLCKTAEGFLSEAANRFESVITKLEQQYEELYEERERASKARRRLEKETLDVQQKQEQLDSLRERLLAGEEDVFRKEFRDARDKIRLSMQTLQKDDQTNWQAIRDAEAALRDAEALAKKAAQPLRPASPAVPLPLSSLTPGTRVFVPSLKTHGEILEAPHPNGEIAVQIGTLRMRLPSRDLQAASASPSPSSPKKPEPKPDKPSTRRRSPDHEAEASSSSEERVWAAVQTSSNSCDLRGMRVDEALEIAEAFLDRAIQNELPTIFLIHGHGTGALRDAIRELCRRSSYIAQFRPGGAEEGGNGVTVVRLAF